MNDGLLSAARLVGGHFRNGKPWLRVYMRSKMIKHNKDLLECVGDTLALLEQLHAY